MDAAEAHRVAEAILRTWPTAGDRDAALRRLLPAVHAHLIEFPMTDVLAGIQRLADRETMPSAARIAASVLRATWDREHHVEPRPAQAPEADRPPAAHAPEAR